MPEALDWTIAVDDHLCERWQACIECGAPAKRGDFVEVGGLVLAIGRCQRCYASDVSGVVLCARLEARARDQLLAQQVQQREHGRL